MKIFKLALISIVVFFLLLTAFSLLLPSNQIISRAIDIKAPVDSVFQHVNNLGQWSKWIADYDSSTTFISPVNEGEGASIKMNKTQVIIEESSLKKIATTWRSGNSTILPGEFNFITNDGAGYLTVQWQFNHKVKWYPWEKFASIVADKALGPYMEMSLDNLKRLVEKAH